MTKENGVGLCNTGSFIDLRSKVFGDSVDFLYLWFLNLHCPLLHDSSSWEKQTNKNCCLMFLFLNNMNHFAGKSLASQHFRLAGWFDPLTGGGGKSPEFQSQSINPSSMNFLPHFGGRIVLLMSYLATWKNSQAWLRGKSSVIENTIRNKLLVFTLSFPSVLMSFIWALHCMELAEAHDSACVCACVRTCMQALAMEVRKAGKCHLVTCIWYWDKPLTESAHLLLVQLPVTASKSPQAVFAQCQNDALMN